MRGQISKRQAAAASEAGAAIIEMALLSPLLFLLLLGTADLGRMVYMYIEVSHAARAGAQYGAQDHIRASDTAGIAAAATNDAPNISSLSVTSSHSCQCSDGSSSSCQITDCSGSHLVEFVQVNTSATYSVPFSYAPVGVTGRTVRGRAILRVDP